MRDFFVQPYGFVARQASERPAMRLPVQINRESPRGSSLSCFLFSLQIARRVDVGAVLEDLEVAMCAGAASGIADCTDFLS